MFRSGSTLIEQVLGAHPDLVAGGELDWFPRLAARLTPFPAALASLSDADASALAHAYREHLAQRFPQASGARYLSDKRPDNFLLIGLIQRLFPGARIVHTRRDPIDNGFSIYTQHLNQDVSAYASDLANIGHYYGQYRRLMAHWHASFPGLIHDFDYDAFVREPEPVLSRLLEFLGLDWNDRCLQFHGLGGAVKTASYWQVREPLHAGASGRWRPYARQLGPLRDAFARAGVALAD
jgi:hypothetical protein